MENYKTKTFVDKSIKIHGDKYLYDKVDYINNHTKVTITCKTHGDFIQSPSKHLCKQGCPSCSKVKKITQEEFVKRAKRIHNDFYNYDLAVFKNVESKVKIICPIHGEFEQRADHHLEGRKCKKCSCKSPANKKRFENACELFVKRASEKWNGKYDYSKVIYENARKKVKIICPNHGEFLQSPDTHLKHECIKCSTENTANRQRHNTMKFIENAKKIHGDNYDYSKVNYRDSRTKVEIICKKHGSFFQTPYNHLQNKGCMFCKNKSKGEESIKKFLKENFIAFKRQKTFCNCVNPKTNKKLRFDFYLMEKNICIEYDGQQHFNSIDHWGGEKTLKENKRKDKIKNEYCKNHNIRLIRISYKENVVDILSQKLLKTISQRH